MQEILRMQGMTKSFSGNVVLNNVDFDLRAGEVHSLIGENGAGKSTLMKILMGVYRADAGKIYIGGKEIEIDSPAKALSNGIAMIHQELVPIPDMTVADNIFVGRELEKFGFVHRREQERKAAEILKGIGLDIAPQKKMRELSVSEMQMVEIAKTISRGARIIIMDEPTSAITESEVRKLFDAIRKLCSQGIGIIYISHKMEELFEISNRVTVLRDGALIGTDSILNMTHQKLVKMMVGREIADVYPECCAVPSDVILSVRNLTRDREFYDISFDLRRGERLGIGGLIGAGRTEVVMTIFGERRPQSGEVYLNGKKINIRSPRQAIANKIALISEDRKRYGLNLMASTRDNIVSIIEKKLTKAGFFQFHKADEIAKRMTNRLNVKVSSPKQIVGSLSGGNQQKVVLAKWLAEDIEVFIFDEPTRGIDVGAKAEIYKLINDLTAQGKGVILISSELPEMIGLCDRMIVLHDKRFAGALEKSELTQENIMMLASGGEVGEGGQNHD